MTDFLTDKEFEDFKTVIYNESGITFSSSNRSILESRLKEKLREKALSTPSDYYKLITKEMGIENVFPVDMDAIIKNIKGID